MWFRLLIIAAGVGPYNGQSVAADELPLTKLVRGVANISTGWLELPKQIHRIVAEEGWVSGDEHPSLAPLFWGVIRFARSRRNTVMPNITLLYSPTCGACPSAKSLWKELRVKYSFSYREVDITTPDGQELADRHAVRAVPATIIDGRLTFVGVPSRQSAEKALQLKMRPRET